MHDIVDMERRGRPAVLVASRAFVEAAAAQSAALGMDVERVFVPHPIQDRTDAELWAYADAAIEEILDRLTA